MMAFNATRPICLIPPAPAMPTTRVEKINGAMITLIKLRKMRLKILIQAIICTLTSDEESQWCTAKPTATPTNMPITICVVNERRSFRGMQPKSVSTLLPSQPIADEIDGFQSLSTMLSYESLRKLVAVCNIFGSGETLGAVE